MADLLIAASFAVFVWWFSTGLVLLLDGLPRGTFRWSLVISSLLAVAALIGLVRASGQTTVQASYCGFACALLVWGWHELSFLTGWITGPRKQPSPDDAPRSERFGHALGAILWHELAIAAVGVAILILTYDAPNQVGTWTFLVLWVMRISAKLNLFLGVRNTGKELLPEHLAYMGSFFRRRTMNGLFPFCVAASSVMLVAMALRLQEVDRPWAAVGLVLVGTLLALAILEHLLLMLPLPSTALWRWALRERGQVSGIAPSPALPAMPSNRSPAPQGGSRVH
jgi:putative photosynthetic complex assembly protein 2